MQQLKESHGETLLRQQCLVPGCERKKLSRQLCRRHYLRWQRHGDPAGKSALQGAGREFIEEAVRSSTEDCIIWPYAKNQRGYGHLIYNGKDRGAHRLVCELAHGEPPEKGLHAAHSCANKSCVNPSHLRWTTPLENGQDRILHRALGIGK